MISFSQALFVSNVVLSAFAASKNCQSAQADAVRNIRFKIQYSPSTMEGQAMSAWGGGGGPHGKVPTGSGMNALNNTFGGREFGGGDRNTIFGTREYGSGYPYGADGANPTSSIAGRPFPYGVWPISWGPGYLGGDEFHGDDMDMIRPGGPLAVVRVGTTDTTKWPGISQDEVYDMIGDKESISFMMADLVDWCHATPQWPKRLVITGNTTRMPRPENVIQYYRASSFALAFSGYNSSVGSTAGSRYSFDQTPPLPSGISNSAFLKCLNETISIALPIMDAYDPPGDEGLTGGQIAGIVIGSIFGAALAVIVFSWIKETWEKWILDRDLRKAHAAWDAREAESNNPLEPDNNPVESDNKQGNTNTVYQ